ncbi:hypothetical protein KC906_03290 [Candidatus Kaiserbacteria bacterium]|nr:hypothetical protein [Candidatus Kaiserbacteria bacterium]
MWLQAIREVLQDLWQFVVTGLLRGKTSVAPLQLPGQTAMGTNTSIPAERFTFPGPKVSLSSDEAFSQTVYVAVPHLPCLARPALNFDLQLGLCTYAQTVQLLRTAGEYAEVRTGALQGWVLQQGLTDRRSAVFPECTDGVLYTAVHPETEKLRLCLKDDMLGGVLGLSLQPSEYVRYRLWQRRVQVPWAKQRPRVAGEWQRLLKGARGVRIGIEPRTGAVLEHVREEGSDAFLGYVETVHPDLSISLSSVGRVNDGEYRYEQLAHAEWKEWRPVFISFA